jgi:uncharacterized protein (TIGR02996 family)
MAIDRQTQWGLIRGILAEPDEDGPRLVYADWLEDNGDPLCELVRVQTELRHVGLGRARRQELRRRERELLDGLGFDRRAVPVEDFHGHDCPRSADGWDYAVSDGLATLFLHPMPGPGGALGMPPPEWAERFGWFILRTGSYDSWESRFELEDPWMRALLDSPLMEHCIGLDLREVQRWYKAIEMLAQAPAASDLLRLDLGNGPGELTTLASSPHLSGLLDLNVSNCYLGDEAVQALAASRALPRLRRLGLSGVRASAESIAVLARSPHFPELRSLDVSDNDVDLAAAQALAEGKPGLVELNVSESDSLTDEAALELIRSPRLGRLRRLGLWGTPVGLPTVEALCDTDRFFRCGELSLARCSITDAALNALTRSPHAALLRVLTAFEVDCTDGAAEVLAASPHLKGLRKLDLARSRIGPEGVEVLTDEAAFPELDELTLAGNALGDRGAVALARWGRRRGATNLLLHEVGLTAAGVAEMVRSGNLAGLEHLELADNAIGDEGVAALALCPELTGLRFLDLGDVGLTDAGARLLIESPFLPRELFVWAYGNPGPSDEMQQALRQRFTRA